VRRFSSEKPETSAGEPLPIELRALQRLGLTGPPEQLNAEDIDALWDFVGECGAPQVAAELSIDPVWTGWPTDLDVDGHALIAWPASEDGVSGSPPTQTRGPLVDRSKARTPEPGW
jgi:hypothetical protein